MAIVMKNVACSVEATGPIRALTFGRAVLSGVEETIAAPAWVREGFRTAETTGGPSCVPLVER